MRLPVRAVQRLQARAAGDDGISLLEVVVALMIIAVVMTSAAGFFLHSLKTTGGAASRQTAVDVANQELENIRAVPPSSLLTGRTQSAVQTLLAWPGAADLTKYDDITAAGGVKNYDPQATVDGGAAVPTVTTQTLNNQTFTLHNFIDPCWLPIGTAQTAATNNLACGSNPTPPAGTTMTDMLRVTVAASWVGGAATDCTQGCTYAASTLVDPHQDPTFESNISHPTITSIAPNALALGATVTVTVNGSGFKAGATASVSATSPSTCSATMVSVGPNITDTTMTVTLTGTAVGSCVLTVTNPDGGNASNTFQVDNPPVFTSSSPVVQNYTSGTVTITGSNFAAPSVSPTSGTWTTSSSTATQIVGSYSANAPTAGAVSLTIQNPDGGTATGSITVTKSTPTIKVTSAGTLVAGSSSTVTMSGTNLAPSGETVTSGGAGAISGLSASSGGINFTYVAPSTAGTVTFTVKNPDGGTATATVTIKVATPTVTTVADSTTSTCTGSFWGYCYAYSYTTSYTITGTNFSAGTPSVNFTFGGKATATGTLTVTGGTQITFTQTSTSNPTGTAYIVSVTVNGQTSNSKSGTV